MSYIKAYTRVLSTRTSGLAACYTTYNKILETINRWYHQEVESLCLWTLTFFVKPFGKETLTRSYGQWMLKRSKFVQKCKSHNVYNSFVQLWEWSTIREDFLQWRRSEDMDQKQYIGDSRFMKCDLFNATISEHAKT